MKCIFLTHHTGSGCNTRGNVARVLVRCVRDQRDTRTGPRAEPRLRYRLYSSVFFAFVVYFSIFLYIYNRIRNTLP